MFHFKPALFLIFCSLLFVISLLDNRNPSANASMQSLSSSRNLKIHQHNDLIKRIPDDLLEERSDDDEDECEDDESEKEAEEAERKKQEAKEKKEKAERAKAKAKAISSSKAASKSSSIKAAASKSRKAVAQSSSRAAKASSESFAAISSASAVSVASAAAASSAREAAVLAQAAPTPMNDKDGFGSAAQKIQANTNNAFNIKPQSFVCVVLVVGLGSLIVL